MPRVSPSKRRTRYSLAVLRRLVVLPVLICGAPCGAQVPAADAYSFAERAPRTPVERTIHALLPKVVKIHGASGLATIQAFATGLIVSAKGHILTLDQVLLQEGQTRVVLADGTVHDATLLPPENTLGVRMLKIEVDRDLPFVALPDAGELSNGTFVVSLGNSFRLAEFSEKVSATFGVLVAKAKTGLRYRLQDVDHDGELWITDATNNPGHGGGGLFTLDGRWVGLNAKLAQSRETNTDISAAIPAEDLRAYIERWTLGKIAPAGLDATPTAPAFHGIVLFDHGAGRTSPPAYVEKVAPGSPGAKAGLRADDLIVRVDEQTVRTCRQFDEALRKRAPGESVAITYKRGRDVTKVDLVLEAGK